MAKVNSRIVSSNKSSLTISHFRIHLTMLSSRKPLTLLVIVMTALLLNACATTGPDYTAGGMFQDIEGSGDVWNEVRRGM